MLKLLLGLVVSAACLTVALWDIDFEAVRTSFARANYGTLPLFVLLVGLFFWVKAIRWKYLLRPLGRFHTRDVFPAMMIGFMGNNLLPARLGEFIRVYVLGRQFNLSKTAVLSTIVLERVFDIAAILLLFAIGLFGAEGMPTSYKTFCKAMTVGTGLGFLALAVYVVWTDSLVRWIEATLKRLSFVPEKIRKGLTRMVAMGAQGVSSLKSPRLLVRLTLTSILHWSFNVACVYCALFSFGLTDQVEHPVLASCVVLGTTAFGVTVPSTPGFFGVVQVCFWLSLRIFGVSKADAFAASVYYHMAMYVPVTITGLYFLNRLGLRLSGVEQESEELADENAL
ncbi:MAG: flippase-like domain-containing protein [Planctomycetes bacterium]|nr:flippase-like domain-containing protein [Planctomycetota bacterium]